MYVTVKQTAENGAFLKEEGACQISHQYHLNLLPSFFVHLSKYFSFWNLYMCNIFSYLFLQMRNNKF